MTKQEKVMKVVEKFIKRDTIKMVAVMKECKRNKLTESEMLVVFNYLDTREGK